MSRRPSFLLYTPHRDTTIADVLGKPEYSYYFLMQRFVPLLERLGEVTVVRDPVAQARMLTYKAAVRGRSTLLLVFTPPHKVPLDVPCPMLPVLAWEYSTIPSEPWSGEVRNDWRTAITAAGGVITCSRAALRSVRDALGVEIPACSLPAPLWDRFARLAARKAPGAAQPPWTLAFDGFAVDSRAIGLDGPAPVAPALERGPQSLTLSGVVYTAVFNPVDVRKNWGLLLEAFLWTFREEPDATLLLKVIHHDPALGCRAVHDALVRFSPFKCRVVVVHGYLSDEVYDAMIAGTSYAVNTAMGEGLCLPLVEFMSAGTPAIAPVHTAMEEYVSSANAFTLRSTLEWTQWPHDSRGVLRAFIRLVEWDSLVDAFAESWQVATSDPQRYQAMSRAATESLRAHASEAVVGERLRTFLEEHRRYRRMRRLRSLGGAWLRRVGLRR